MSKFGYLTLAALALGLLGITIPAASAFPVTVPPALETPAAPDLIVPVRNGYHGGAPMYRGNNFYRGPRYNYYRRYNNYPYRRCNGWNGYCGPYYPYNYFGGPFIGLGFGFGPGYYYSQPRYRYTNRHVAWCKNHYRSYKVKTNTWTAKSGKVRKCKSPYWP